MQYLFNVLYAFDNRNTLIDYIVHVIFI